MRRAILCFTRSPEPGHTKTRLQPLLGPQGCARLHSALLWDLARTYAQLEADLFVCYQCEDGPQLLQEIFPRALAFLPQQGEDLGSRMDRALTAVLRGEFPVPQPYDACVLTGSDLPLLTPAHLESAFAALEQAPVTLGPTGDGGYYLVGLRQPCPALFTGQTYSCPTVYQSAVEAAGRAGLGVRPALPTQDLDTPGDLFCLWEEILAAGGATANFLTTIEELREAN